MCIRDRSRSIWLAHTVDSSFFYTSRSNRRIIIFVREIGLSWLQEVNGNSLGAGLLFASFHNNGTVCIYLGMEEIRFKTDQLQHGNDKKPNSQITHLCPQNNFICLELQKKEKKKY